MSDNNNVQIGTVIKHQHSRLTIASLYGQENETIASTIATANKRMGGVNQKTSSGLSKKS